MSNLDLGAIFDWDGVVIDSHDQHERAWTTLAAEIGEVLPPGFFKRIFGLRNPEAITQCTEWADPGDVERVGELARRKEELYREYVREGGVAPIAGALELVAALEAEGIPSAVGTSAPRANIAPVLELLGIGGRFTAIVTAEDVSSGKPDPEVFVRCAEAIDRPPERCVVFEDAHAGVEAARRADMKVIAVTTTHPPESLTAADLVVPDLRSVDVQTVRALFGR